MANENLLKVNLRVEGLVQGVSFRYFTQQTAQKLGVKGFVRNEVDGSVYIEAEAPAEILSQFIAWCHQGPSSARVKKVSQTPAEICHFTAFNIKH